MAYDRNDRRDAPRDERSRWRDERFENRPRGGRDEDRGFFERAGDEIASWFGDDDAERRREREDERGRFSARDREYRSMTGDFGRGEGSFAAGGTRRETERERGSELDPHYHSWRRRQLDELDRDYEDYRRENQARFEDDFTNWRQRRLGKRQMLGQIREQMEVIGNDDQPVGTVDRVVHDRIILAKSDPESGGAHHSLSCSDIDRVEGDRVILDCTGEQAKQRWRDESRGRALFEREDQGEMGDRMLDRSFSGTYR